MAAFGEGFDLRAFEVLADQPAFAFETLTQLVDHSLAVRLDSSAGSRSDLLATIKAFALEALEACGELPELRSAHASHFSDVPIHIGSNPGQNITWLDTVESDIDNIRSAL